VVLLRGLLMMERGSGIDKHGRIWKARVVPTAEAEEEDFRFWFEGLSPEERVTSVDLCLSGCLKTRGANGTPRLRRVFRIVKRKWR
jgi:hypothetical protein